MPDNTKNGAIASQRTDERTSFFTFVKSHTMDLLAYAGLAVMLILFLIFNSGPRLMYNFSAVVQAAAVYSILANEYEGAKQG